MMRLEDLLVQEENREHKHRVCQTTATHVDSEDAKATLMKKKKKKKKRALEKEVTKLEGELEEEEALNKALNAVLKGPVLSQPRLSLLLLPPQVQELIEELAMVEAETLCLEKQIHELKLDVYKERKDMEECEAKALWQIEEEQRVSHRRLQRQNHLPCAASNDPMRDDLTRRSKSQNYGGDTKETKTKSPGTVSIGSAMELSRIIPSSFSGEVREKERANEISEGLVKCLMGIYLQLSSCSSSREREQGSTSFSKLSLSHLKTASFKRKSVYQNKASNLDPYGIVMPNLVRDIGHYTGFIHITRSSIDVSRLSHCSTSIVHLRVLMEKLNKVDLSFLSYKKKLAFWINIYNSCVMNGFLEHGLPTSKEKLFALHRMAMIDVGGTKLNAQEIKQFVLQNQCEHQEPIRVGEKEANLQKRYGLRCSEPNLAFVLCHGDWSSPAVRVYTADALEKEMIKARTEYLEASIGVVNRCRIVIPQVLHLRYREFAEDDKSFLEWIDSQLPPLQRCLHLKETMMECLKQTPDVPLNRLLQVRPHHYEFRYLFPL